MLQAAIEAEVDAFLTEHAGHVDEDGYYRHTLKGKVDGKTCTTRVVICVASKYYTDKRTNEPGRKELLFTVHRLKQSPKFIRETYRKRYRIETSYRQMNEASMIKRQTNREKQRT